MDTQEVSGEYLEKVITSSVFLSTLSKAFRKSFREECSTSFAVMASRQSLDQIICTPIVCEEGIKYCHEDIESIGRIPAYEIFDNKQLLVSLNLNYDELNNLRLFCIDDILNVGQIGLYGSISRKTQEGKLLIAQSKRDLTSKAMNEGFVEVIDELIGDDSIERKVESLVDSLPEYYLKTGVLCYSLQEQKKILINNPEAILPFGYSLNY